MILDENNQKNLKRGQNPRMADANGDALPPGRDWALVSKKCRQKKLRLAESHEDLGLG